MSASKTIDYLQNELSSDQPTTTLMAAIKVMQPGIDRLVYDAGVNATQAVCNDGACI